ncbi:MAG: hypothetical protein NNA20_06115 [Nitrospira sp.]|nr:hypothetical protein [Nitrospira sp.]
MKRDVLVEALQQTHRSGETSSLRPNFMNDMAWRLDRLEGQLKRLSELVRDHAEDMDRLVRIVAEDRDIIRRQLLQKHREKVRARKHVREAMSRAGLKD